jgi:predicted DNA-binding protein with PD1-like motif
MTMLRNLFLFTAAWAILSPLGAQSPPPLDDGYVRRTPVAGHGLAPGMQAKQLANTGRTFEVTMRKGDDVVAGLTEFAEQNHLKLAHFTGVGALGSGVLGWFDPDKRAYKKITIDQEVEVVSFAGNITLDNNGKPSLHAHCVVALSDGSTRGGHLIEGHVSLAMQVFVVDSDVPEEAKPPK